MVSRHGTLGKILGAFILSVFVVYVIPHAKPTVASLVVVFLSVGLIADALARFFAGKNDWKILIPAALIVVADLLFFIYVPASPI